MNFDVRQATQSVTGYFAVATTIVNTVMALNGPASVIHSMQLLAAAISSVAVTALATRTNQGNVSERIQQAYVKCGMRERVLNGDAEGGQERSALMEADRVVVDSSPSVPHPDSHLKTSLLGAAAVITPIIVGALAPFVQQDSYITIAAVSTTAAISALTCVGTMLHGNQQIMNARASVLTRVEEFKGTLTDRRHGVSRNTLGEQLGSHIINPWDSLEVVTDKLVLGQFAKELLEGKFDLGSVGSGTTLHGVLSGGTE